MPDVLNISGYQFTHVADPPALRDVLHAAAEAGALRGTVLLAHEGVNLFLAGSEAAIDGFLAVLRAHPGLAGFEAKRSWSHETPFRRLRVKVKREIIRMNQPAIAPQDGRAPALDARTLRRWLDQGHDDAGRPVVTLDTRNAFEVDYGAFAGALDWRLERFTQFPDAAAAAAADLRGKTVVSYCTGGIRCEKAALYLREEGVEAFQLDGGILGYFEQVGGAHWTGECFVFDGREALAPDLSPRSEAA